MNKRNILIIAANGLGKTGVPNVIYQVVEALCTYASLDIVVFNDDDFYRQKLINLGARIIRVDEKEPKKTMKRFFWRLFLEKHFHRSIFKKIFSEKKYDAIHSFKEHNSAYLFSLSEKYGISERIIHCNNEIKEPRHFISKLIFRKKMRLIKKKTTRLIGVSSECCKASYPGMSFDVLYNTYDESVFNDKVKNFLSEKELVLSQVATFSRRKNQLFSIEVFYNVLQTYKNAKLNLIGFEVEQGYLGRIKETISKYGLSKSVNIIDGRGSIVDYFKYSSFVLLPSLHEAAPITLVEAQACGITCFASEKITKDMNCGGVIYLPIDNPALWGKAIVSAFVSNGNSRRFYDMKRFSSSSFKSCILKIYRFE